MAVVPETHRAPSNPAPHPANTPPADQVADDVAEAAQDTQELLVAAHTQLNDQVRAHPYAAIAAAAGFGYVLGAGVPGWALRMAVNNATRALVATYLVPKVLGSED